MATARPRRVSVARNPRPCPRHRGWSRFRKGRFGRRPQEPSHLSGNAGIVAVLRIRNGRAGLPTRKRWDLLPNNSLPAACRTQGANLALGA